MNVNELRDKSIEEILKLNPILIGSTTGTADYSLNTVSKDVIESEMIYLESFDVYGIWRFTDDNICHLLFVYNDKLYITAFDAIFTKKEYPLLIDGAKIVMESCCEEIDIEELSREQESWEELWAND